MTRAVYLALGALFFSLAVLGVALPILPTTPFLLLTSWCLVRSSPDLNAKLRRSPLFGPLLRDWEDRRGVRPHVKVTAVATIAIAVSASFFAGGLSTPLRVVLVLLGLVGATVVLRLRTVRD